MSEPIFLRKSPGLTLDEVVALTGATLAICQYQADAHQQYCSP